MISRKALLSVACMTLAVSAMVPVSSAHAQEVGNIDYYQISNSEYSNHYQEWKNFLEYQHREPCQNYVAPPAGFYLSGCDVYRVEQPRAMAQTTTTTVQTTQPKMLPIVSSYTLYFDFDKSNVRGSEQATIDRLASELNTYHPTQVTVAGHADTSGAADYNKDLSAKRAQAVAQALSGRGIENQVIDKEAYGETDLAVPTADGVKNEENRRVTVDFRR